MKLLNKVTIAYYLPVALALLACSKHTIQPVDDHCYVNGIDTCNKQAQALKLNVNLQNEHQTIEGFGASDCWTTKYVGKWANATKKNQIADYLFSSDTDKTGNPIGIGLSFWRFNIGAGSFEQGDSSGIPDIYRREECFLNADGSYDWSKQAGQQWFLNAAKARGVKNFIGFAISPPVQMTVNNRAYGLGTNQLNLKAQDYAAYADFLVSVASHFNAAGIPMNYISPFNEPQWNWGTSPTQEGTGATNTQMAQLIKILGPKLQQSGIPAKIAFGEANQWNSLYENNGDDRGDQLNQLFNASSPNYIGNVPSLLNMISSHSYFTTCPNSDMVSYRQNVLQKRDQVAPTTELWETEFGILGDICGQLNGYPRNTGIDYGLYVANVIASDLTIANVSSWQWWLGVDTYNYSDGLIYINDNAGGYDLGQMQTDGIVSNSKQLWCLGNFSRFIRPGMIRVDANISSITDPTVALATQMVSAYKDVAHKQIVIVIINNESASKQISLSNSSFSLSSALVSAYTTSVNKSLKRSIVNSSLFSVDAKSVTTLIANYQ